jgi:Phasin protein
MQSAYDCCWRKCEVPECPLLTAVGVIADVTQTSFEDRFWTHHDISLRCAIWSLSGHSGLWPAERPIDLWVHGLGGKARDCAEKNISIARDYMHKLSRAKNFLEAVPIHTEFMQSQLGFIGEQIKSFGEIYTKAAAEVLNAPFPRFP